MKRPYSDLSLLRTLCAIHAPSGNEVAMKDFILRYVRSHASKWIVQPQVIAGEAFQDNVMLVFGKPRTAVFAHIDSIGFTVRYGRQLVKIGGPATATGMRLIGKDSKGRQYAELEVREKPKTGIKELFYTSKREFETGTELVFRPDWREDRDHVQCCYMDNRLGVFCALKLAETLRDGILVFSTWEEHGGGSVSYLQRYIQETYGVRQALIADISWVTEGVRPGKGPVISMRDSLIPRRSYVQRIIDIAEKAGCLYQREVEGTGGSDGRELQMSEYPWDWCFVGAPEDHVHSPDEKVHRRDIDAMIRLYRVLMNAL